MAFSFFVHKGVSTASDPCEEQRSWALLASKLGGGLNNGVRDESYMWRIFAILIFVSSISYIM